MEATVADGGRSKKPEFEGSPEPKANLCENVMYRKHCLTTMRSSILVQEQLQTYYPVAVSMRYRWQRCS